MNRLLFIFSIVFVLPLAVIAQEEDAITGILPDSETTDQWRHIVYPITPIHEHNGYAGGSGRFDYNDAFDHDDETIDSPNYHSLDIEEGKSKINSDFSSEILEERQIAFEQVDRFNDGMNDGHGIERSSYSDARIYGEQRSSDYSIRKNYKLEREGYFYP